MIYIIKPDTNVMKNLMVDLGNLNPHKAWQVEVKEYNKKRSNPQNALMWKWINIISGYTGYTEEELHEGFKRNYIGADSGKDMFGNEYIKAKSSTKLNTKEFSEYMNKIEQFALLNDIRLPTPDYYGLG